MSAVTQQPASVQGVDIGAQNGSSKLILLTGGNSGIGLEACKALCKEGHKVVATVRSDEKGQHCVSEVRTACPEADIHYMLCEMSDAASVKELAEKFKAEWLKDGQLLDVLINNAGGSPADTKRVMSPQNPEWEICVATNCFGPILLTDLLTEQLKETAAKKGSATVVMVGSSIINSTTISKYRPDPDDLMMAKPGVFKAGGFMAYKNSKTAFMWATLALVDELEGSGVRIHSMCPGVIPGTNLSRDSLSARRLVRFITCCCRCIFKPQSVERGGSYIVDLATHNKAGTTNGKFWLRGVITDIPSYCLVKENQVKVLKSVREMTGSPMN